MNWQTIQEASWSEILAWAEAQAWCQAMAQCAQDSQWHAEGDVWTHTKLVCEELINLPEWESLNRDEQGQLWFTALFHDSAKPMTSQVDSETGRIRSPKHSIKGEMLARNVLRELNCDLGTRESICSLVRYHGRPPFLLDRAEPSHEVARMSWLLENRLLYLFALADTRGRSTKSMSRPEENLHYWKLQSEELSCYTRPFAFASDHARFCFARQQEPNLYYQPHEDFSCRVTMMCGLPGAGKDTWLKNHREETPVVSLDGIRRERNVSPKENQGEIVQEAKERCRVLLRRGESFAFNATNLLRQTRGRWLQLFSDYRAQIEIVYIEPPMQRILQQNSQRSASVPTQVIQDFAAKCEPPNWLEAHQVQFVGE